MMKILTVSFAVIALVAQTAQAGHLGFGGGGLGLGGHHGGFGDEASFSDLRTDYDTGLAEIINVRASEITATSSSTCNDQLSDWICT